MFVSLAPCQTSRCKGMRRASNIVSVSVSTKTSCEAWDGCHGVLRFLHLPTFLLHTQPADL